MRILARTTALFLLVATMSCTADRTVTQAPTVRWEYSTIAGSPDPEALEKHLDEAGAEGWELVAVDSAKQPFGRVYILKRQLRDLTQLHRR